jgi:hypothetical protein
MYYGEGILILPLDTFNLTSIKQTVNNLVIFKERYKCFISIIFESGLRRLTITFEDTDLFPLIVNVDMFIMTKILLKMSHSSIDNSIGFSCNKEDLCDQQFVFDYLEWLFNVEYNSLASNVRPLLLTGNNQKGK